MWNYYFCLTFVYRSLSNTQAIPSNFSLASITMTHILSSLQSSVFSPHCIVILRSCAADCWLRGERGIYWALQECWYRQQPGRHVHPVSWTLLSSLWLTPRACRVLQGAAGTWPTGLLQKQIRIILWTFAHQMWNTGRVCTHWPVCLGSSQKWASNECLQNSFFVREQSESL